MNPSFIEVYDHALTDEECQMCIDLFEEKDQLPTIIPHPEYPQNNRIVKKDKETYYDMDDNSPMSDLVFDRVMTCLGEYAKKYNQFQEIVSPIKLDSKYNFQKYEHDDEGYLEWHAEHGFVYPQRMMAWMIYLNDAKSGTDFMFYDNLDAKRGRLVLWPAFFTHIHKSTKNVGVKYILTGWINYWSGIQNGLYS